MSQHICVPYSKVTVLSRKIAQLKKDLDKNLPFIGWELIFFRSEILFATINLTAVNPCSSKTKRFKNQEAEITNKAQNKKQNHPNLD